MLALGIFACIGTVYAEEGALFELFYSDTCPHCHQELEWLSENFDALYPDVEFRAYEIMFHSANRAYFEQRMTEFNVSSEAVPTNVIGSQVIVGYDQAELLAAMEVAFGAPQEVVEIEETQEKWQSLLQWSWPVMSFGLGLIDGFNPCAMWSLVVLLGFLLSLEKSWRRWLIGGVFIGASFVLYFGALLTYLGGFELIAGLLKSNAMGWVLRGVGVLAILAGGQAIYMGYRNAVECKTGDLKKKQQFRSKMTAILEQEQFALILVGITGLAFAVNSVELFCSIAIPTAFTGALTATDLPFWKQLSAIFIYDVAYILDDVAVFLIAMWTFSIKFFTARATRISHFVGGAILIFLGGTFLLRPEILTRLFG